MTGRNWFHVLLVALFVASANCLIDTIEEEIYDGKDLKDIDSQRNQVANCGLSGIKQDTSSSDPYIFPVPFNDNLQNNELAWENPIFGNVYSVRVEGTPHAPYMKAEFRLSTSLYRMLGNERTKNFVREQRTRDMIRNVIIYCDGGSTSVKYYFKMPFQDMTPPVFSQEEYTFDITADWNLDRPISDGQFVVVSDNAVELEKNLELKFIPSQDVIKVVPHKLWVLPEPSRYYFRLDLYLTKKLEAGRNVQVLLSAFDEFTGGTTKINIRVE